MEVNIDKYALYVTEEDAQSRHSWEQSFPYPIINMNDDVKYLGSTLKPNNYGKAHWYSSISRIEKRVSLIINGYLEGGDFSLLSLCYNPSPSLDIY